MLALKIEEGAPQARNAGGLWKLEKAREQILLQSSKGGMCSQGRNVSKPVPFSPAYPSETHAGSVMTSWLDNKFALF